MKPLNGYFLLFLMCFVIFSCKSRERNYIVYYQKVNEIDSIYRLANQPEQAVKKYKKLFRKFEPKQQRYTQEFGTYLVLADQYNIDYGGEKEVRKLIRLLAPSSHFNYWDRDYLLLFAKYHIDSLELKIRNHSMEKRTKPRAYRFCCHSNKKRLGAKASVL